MTASARDVKPKRESQLQLSPAGRKSDDVPLPAVPKSAQEEDRQEDQEQKNIVQTSMTLPPLDTTLALPTPELYSTTSTEGSWQQIERNQQQQQGQQTKFETTGPGMIQSPFLNAMSPPLTPGIPHLNEDHHHHQHQQQRRVFSPPISVSQGKHGLTVMTSSSPIPFASSADGSQSEGDPSRAGSRPSTSIGEMALEKKSSDE